MALLEGKKIVVTGASSGIGEQTALTMAREGAELLITYNSNKDGADEVANQIQKIGAKVHVFKVDIRSEKEIEELCKYSKDVLDTVDVLVNNAGVYTYNSVLDTTVEQWDLNLDVNLKGTFLASRIFSKNIFVPRKRGRILNMASFVGIVPVSGLVAYNCAKAAIIHLTKQLALELGQYNVDVICVSPGYVATKPMLDAIERGDADGPSILRQSPVGRLAQPEEVAHLYTYLASDKASYLSGINISIDGAYTSGIRFTKLVDGEIVAY
jgi:3-oxoacyl-[acyl-carrier protein] reductase